MKKIIKALLMFSLFYLLAAPVAAAEECGDVDVWVSVMPGITVGDISFTLYNNDTGEALPYIIEAGKIRADYAVDTISIPYGTYTVASAQMEGASADIYYVCTDSISYTDTFIIDGTAGHALTISVGSDLAGDSYITEEFLYNSGETLYPFTVGQPYWSKLPADVVIYFENEDTGVTYEMVCDHTQDETEKYLPAGRYHIVDIQVLGYYEMFDFVWYASTVFTISAEDAATVSIPCYSYLGKRYYRIIPVVLNRDGDPEEAAYEYTVSYTTDERCLDMEYEDAVKFGMGSMSYYPGDEGRSGLYAQAACDFNVCSFFYYTGDGIDKFRADMDHCHVEIEPFAISRGYEEIRIYIQEQEDGTYVSWYEISQVETAAEWYEDVDHWGSASGSQGQGIWPEENTSEQEGVGLTVGSSEVASEGAGESGVPGEVEAGIQTSETPVDGSNEESGEENSLTWRDIYIAIFITASIIVFAVAVAVWNRKGGRG